MSLDSRHAQVVGVQLSSFEHVGHFVVWMDMESIIIGYDDPGRIAGRLLWGVESFSFCSPHRRSARTQATSRPGQHHRYFEVHC
jgi:hypothetical protein